MVSHRVPAEELAYGRSRLATAEVTIGFKLKTKFSEGLRPSASADRATAEPRVRPARAIWIGVRCDSVATKAVVLDQSVLK